MSNTGDNMRSLQGKKVLVTGADGFIPSYVCESLVEAGAEVRALARRNSSSVLKNIGHLKEDMEIVWGDITDGPAMIRFSKGVEIIYHLAANSHVAYSIEQPAESFMIQCQGTLNVMEAARFNEVERVIHAGSAEEYGLVQDVKIKEDFPLLPRSPYAAGKVAADRLMYSYWCSYGTPVVMSRFFGIYGPRQSAEKAIPKFIFQVDEGTPISIYGDGSQTRDFMFGSDAGNAYALLGVADGVVGNVLNIGTGVKYPIIDVARDIVRFMGKEDSAIIEKDLSLKPGEASHLVADPTDLETALGWKPTVSWQDGLQRTIEFYLKNKDKYVDLAGRI